MAWPVIHKNDLFSLCEPFNKKNNLVTHTTKKFSGVVFFDVGSILLDLNWESFYAAVATLVKPSNKFSFPQFLAHMRDEKLNSIWSQGKITTLNYIDKFIEIIKASCKNQNGISISHYALKQVDSLVVAQPRKRVLDLANKLRKNNFVVCLLSNTTPWHVPLIYENIHVSHNFDIGVFSPDVGYEKPDIEIYKIAHSEATHFVEKKFGLNLEKNDVYFVDDTPENVQAAIAFGWNARLVNLINENILNLLKKNKLNEFEFQQASQQRENLLFGDQAAVRVEEIFQNLLLEVS